MEASSQTARAPVAERIQRIPRPEEPVPPLAWPTVGVFAAGLGIWLGSGSLYLEGIWPWPLATVVNGVAAFMLFTIAHEAAHRTISTREGVNTWFGRVATFILNPVAGFQLLRYVHMQHHRFTNDEARTPTT